MHFSTHLRLVKGNPWHIPLPCALLLGVVGFLAISLTSPSSARLALPATESSSSSPQLVIKNFHSTKIERVGRQTKHLPRCDHSTNELRRIIPQMQLNSITSMTSSIQVIPFSILTRPRDEDIGDFLLFSSKVHKQSKI